MLKKISSLLFYSSILLLSNSVNAEELDPKFYNGEIRLSKSLFDTSAYGRDELRNTYASNDWNKLVRLVLSKKAAWDTYYFYLGRSAEELGYKKAAITYYNLAINSEKYKKCNYSSLINLCDGFNFPQDAIFRRDALLSEGKYKIWEINKGPSLQDYLKISPQSIVEISSISNIQDLKKSKFETDADFENRLASTNQDYLLTFDLDTDRKPECLSTYDHSKSTYEVKNCQLFSKDKPLFSEVVAGKSFTLANAFDKREISKKIINRYFFESDTTLSFKLNISAAEAKKIDTDLAVGILFSEKSTKVNCEICKLRERNDAIDELAKSVSELAGKPSFKTSSWKDEAFKTGVLIDDTTYIVSPKKLKKLVVFNRTNNKILYERDMTE